MSKWPNAIDTIDAILARYLTPTVATSVAVEIFHALRRANLIQEEPRPVADMLEEIAEYGGRRLDTMTQDEWKYYNTLVAKCLAQMKIDAVSNAREQ